MNRTERRLARKRGGSVPGPQGPAETGLNSDISALFASATEHYRQRRDRAGERSRQDDPRARSEPCPDAQSPRHHRAASRPQPRGGETHRSGDRARSRTIPLSTTISASPSGARLTAPQRSRILRQAISSGLRDETTLVNDNVFVARCIRRIEAAWPRRLTLQELFGEDGIDAFVADNLLFRCLLQFGYAHDRVSRAISHRTSLCGFAEVASADASTLRFNDEVLIFLCALAQQCFSNGYVFALSSGEMESVRLLHDALAEKLSSGADIDPLLLIAIAAYAPLYLLPTADAIAAHAWPRIVARRWSPSSCIAPRAESEILKINTIAYSDRRRHLAAGPAAI